MVSRSQVQTSRWTTGRLARTVGAVLEGHSEVSVTGVQEDSRSCVPGDLFVAIQGAEQDGLRYAADAVERGAVAIASERDPKAGVPWLCIANARTGAGRLADLVYDDPSGKLALIGVTGTNGKTTTAHLLRQILPGPVGFIGTTGVDWPGKSGGATKAVNTTPGPTSIRRHLCDMLEAGCIACVMEVSSHALSQGRTDGLGQNPEIALYF